jgi:cytochrome b subunit of formate dehydrogenase
MTDGDVDQNWAKEHHSPWLENLRREGKLEYKEPRAKEQTAPAE